VVTCFFENVTLTIYYNPWKFFVFCCNFLAAATHFINERERASEREIVFLLFCQFTPRLCSWILKCVKKVANVCFFPLLCFASYCIYVNESTVNFEFSATLYKLKSILDVFVICTERSKISILIHTHIYLCLKTNKTCIWPICAFYRKITWLSHDPHNFADYVNMGENASVRQFLSKNEDKKICLRGSICVCVRVTA